MTRSACCSYSIFAVSSFVFQVTSKTVPMATQLRSHFWDLLLRLERYYSCQRFACGLWRGRRRRKRFEQPVILSRLSLFFYPSFLFISHSFVFLFVFPCVYKFSFWLFFIIFFILSPSRFFTPLTFYAWILKHFRCLAAYIFRRNLYFLMSYMYFSVMTFTLSKEKVEYFFFGKKVNLG